MFKACINEAILTTSIYKLTSTEDGSNNEKVNFEYSSKNSPICNKNEYKLKLIEKIRNFCRRIRLKVSENNRS